MIIVILHLVSAFIFLANTADPLNRPLRYGALNILCNVGVLIDLISLIYLVGVIKGLFIFIVIVVSVHILIYNPLLNYEKRFKQEFSDNFFSLKYEKMQKTLNTIYYVGLIGMAILPILIILYAIYN